MLKLTKENCLSLLENCQPIRNLRRPGVLWKTSPLKNFPTRRVSGLLWYKWHSSFQIEFSLWFQLLLICNQRGYLYYFARPGLSAPGLLRPSGIWPLGFWSTSTRMLRSIVRSMVRLLLGHTCCTATLELLFNFKDAKSSFNSHRLIYLYRIH